MFCRTCGAKMADDAQFCEQCGTAVTRQGTVQAPNGTTTETERVPAPEAAPAQGGTRPRKTAGKKLAVLCAAGALIIIAAVVCLSLFTGGQGGSASPYQDANLNNGGFFAYDDSRLYFIADYSEDDKKKSLYATDYSGNQKTLLASATDIIRIRAIDGKLYYQESNDLYSIGEMTTDGKDKRTIVEFEHIAEKYNVANGHLYYLTDSKLHVCSLSGENDRILAENARAFVLHGDSVYYATEDEIYSLDLKNDQKAPLCKASKASDLVIADKDLYYMVADDGLYRVPLKGDGTSTQIIRDSSIARYTFYGNDIYYIQEIDDDTREALAAYISSSDDETYLYEIALIGCGSIYQASNSGGRGSEVDSDQMFVFSLFTSPDGLYCKTSAFSDSIVKVQLES